MKFSKLLHFVFVALFTVVFLACEKQLSNEELIVKFQEALRVKDWSAAKEYIDEHIKRNPDDIEAYYSRAKIGTNVTPLDLEQIIADLNKHIQKKPENAIAIMSRFQAYLKANRFEEALADIETIIQQKGKNPFLVLWKGNTAFLAKKFDIAAKAYELRTRMPGTYEDIGTSYYYMIFSKYFGNNKEGAIWDTAFLEDRGFEQDSLLMKALMRNRLKYEEVAQFEIPALTEGELEAILKNNCHDFELFPFKKYDRTELVIIDKIKSAPRTRDIESLLPYKDSVYQLNLSFNTYKKLPKSITQFKNLQILDLTSNPFTNIEETMATLSQLPNLKILILDKCGIKEVPDNIKLLNQLLILDLGLNQLETLPEAIGELRNLKLLNIARNFELSRLPKSLQNLQCLQMLDASYTKLKNIPVEVANCSQLVILSAHHAQLETLPENMGFLINLRNLNVHDNNIQKLPQSFGDLEILQYANFSNNRLEDLPTSFQNLDSLQRLFLDGNRLKTFPNELTTLKGITDIFIYDNPMTEIPYSVANLETIEQIVVDARYITQKNRDSLEAINPALFVKSQY
ncbi:MAG: hypothetical protein AAF617_05460 [Bacteroidota bacterium]